jgi:hypothetical protein
MSRHVQIVASLALFIALGGTAHAAGPPECDSVSATQIRAPAIRSLDLGVSTGWEGTSAVKLALLAPVTAPSGRCDS